MVVRNSAAHWLAHAEAEAAKAQQALDDFQSWMLRGEWGQVNATVLHSQMKAARDEYVNDAAYWRSQLN